MSNSISCKYALGSTSVSDGYYNKSNGAVSDNVIYIIEQGEILFESEGESFVAKAGDMVLIPSNVLCSERLTASGFVKKSWIRFTMKRGNQEFFLTLNSPVKITLANKNYVLKIKKYSNLDEPQKTLKTSMSIFKLVSLFLEHTLPSKKTEDKDIASQAVEYIDNNFVEQFSLKFLSKKFGCSPNHFIKIYKEKTGYTPIKYILMKKIDLAKALIKTTDLSINSVMEKVGFDDASYFSKTFKKIVGVSPKAFKDSAEQNLVKVDYE